MKNALKASALLFLISSVPAFAAYAPVQMERPEDPQHVITLPKGVTDYGYKIQDKMDYGMVNFFTGWTKIVTESAGKTKKAFWKGLGRGLILFPIDTLGGALNLASSPVPGIIRLPEDGVDRQKLTHYTPPPAGYTSTTRDRSAVRL